MTLCRVLSIALALAVLPLGPVAAQFGGTPGGTIIPAMPGAPGAGLEAQTPPPVCQQLLNFRAETQKHGQALQAAGRKKAPPGELCKLFQAFLLSESKLINGLEENSAACGVPPDVLKQVK